MAAQDSTLSELQQAVDLLVRENTRLRRAVEGLICWTGQSPDGPSWATPTAKKRNREMYEKAFAEACACFPLVYVSPDDSDVQPEIQRSPN